MTYEAGNGQSWYDLNSTLFDKAVMEAMRLQFPKAKRCKIVVTSATSVSLEYRGERIYIREKQ